MSIDEIINDMEIDTPPPKTRPAFSQQVNALFGPIKQTIESGNRVVLLHETVTVAKFRCARIP